ncbi:hypothetical protein L5515_012864 [Caenorhabditis briggsae]|uniref:Uncharacterized protein n=1 Tax=Caenorhabditis briggsae TaxID=6238 RepID=A0AAE9F0K1_CAEBR|nr:hypothetical protein L5515_012864 [Caenorhabditis briggsae]
MEKVEPAVKKRRLTKKKRIKRRKRLGLDKESEARKTQEFCLKVNERTQNLEEFLKLTGRKPEQRLLEIGNVAKNQQNKGNETTDGTAVKIPICGIGFNKKAFEFKRQEICLRKLTEIEQTVKYFGSSDSHGDSAVIIFITHGNANGILGSDNAEFNVEQVFSLLSPQNAPRLAGKPKIIFTENCRGESQDAGYCVVEEPRSAHGLVRSGMGLVVEKHEEKVGKTTRAIPMTSDFLLCCSTSHGNLAFADAQLGSYHVQLLCETIANRAHKDDLEKMLVEIRKRMSQMEFRGKGILKKQMPETRSTLRKAYLFHIPRKLRKYSWIRHQLSTVSTCFPSIFLPIS